MNTEIADWLGRTEESPVDVLTPQLVRQFRAALDPHLALFDTVPAGIHWCLSPLAVPGSALGVDGHPAKGDFLPPIPLPRRMWAGGQIDFLAPLRVGDKVTRTSRISDIRSKSGRSGALYIVTIEHDLIAENSVVIRERQDIVYREAASAPTPSGPPALQNRADREWQMPVDTVMLFRYSALTFNGHRIHYDERYAREIEFYPGLVIQGPLQATLLLNLATTQRRALPCRFSFRAVSAACGAQTLRARSWPSGDGIALAMLAEDNITSMEATAIW